MPKKKTLCEADRLLITQACRMALREQYGLTPTPGWDVAQGLIDAIAVVDERYSLHPEDL